MYKRIITISFLFVVVMYVFGHAQICNQFQQNRVECQENDVFLPEVVDKDISSETVSAPNEIVGLDGYDAIGSNDTFRWVAAMQTLAYTVYFENDADLAMAAARKVSVSVPLHEKLNYAILGKGRRLILWA